MRAIPVINDEEVGFIPNMVIPIGDGGQASTNWIALIRKPRMSGHQNRLLMADSR